MLVDLERPHTVPAFDVVSNLVFAANASNVDTVVIGGRIVMKGGKVIGIDEATLFARAHEIALRLASDLKLTPRGSWPRE